MSEVPVDPMSDMSFPRLSARTQRFTLGEPRLFTISNDGARAAFVRSAAGDDSVNCLWFIDLASGQERLVADPRQLMSDDRGDLPPEELARRERAREGARGVVSFATDRDVRVAAFALGGELFVAGLLSGQARRLGVEGPVFDPRPDPGAQRVAFVRKGRLCVAELDATVHELTGANGATWGLAEFVAAEEMNRNRGYWWAPDSSCLAVARVDEAHVPEWFISDPAHPDVAPSSHHYPAAGTTNADVSMHIVELDGNRRELEWNRQQFPYLVDVGWRDGDTVTMLVQSRDQREVQWLNADRTTGAVSFVQRDRDETWVDITARGWGWLADGRLVTCASRDGVHRLMVSDDPVSPDAIDVRSVVSINAHDVVFTANWLGSPSEIHLWRWGPSGIDQLTSDKGVHSGWAGGATVIIRSTTLSSSGAALKVLGGRDLASNAATPPFEPNVRLMRLGERRLPAALLLPREDIGTAQLPVLLDPYGGPHAQRVVSAQAAYLSSQWFADQGFAVLIIDGRGTPGLGAVWERSVHLDLAGPVLQDQMDGLHAAAAEEPRLDLSRVAIRGWSFGGYLAALAVLREPSVFHAAIAGAPVTEWRLYDTHYTERYLGNPTLDAQPYDQCSLLNEAEKLSRPLMLIHGLADDNVVSAHTLQLSSALLAAGNRHEVLPLSGVTHMTPQEVVAENLLLLQLDFLRRSLQLDSVHPCLPGS